jgi:hypothetical protein
VPSFSAVVLDRVYPLKNSHLGARAIFATQFALLSVPPERWIAKARFASSLICKWRATEN